MGNLFNCIKIKLIYYSHPQSLNPFFRGDFYKIKQLFYSGVSVPYINFKKFSFFLLLTAFKDIEKERRSQIDLFPLIIKKNFF